MAAVAMASFTVLAIVVVFTFGDRSVDDRLADVAAIPSETVHYSVRDILSFISRPLGPFRRMFRLEGDEDLVYRLSLAGYRESQDIQTFLDAKLLCPVLGVLLGHSLVAATCSSMVWPALPEASLRLTFLLCA